jgi:hypothetical protein
MLRLTCVSAVSGLRGQPLGDLIVAQTAADQGEHLALAICEVRGIGR